MIDPVDGWILLTGALVALSGALLGPFLVLRGQTMAADAIAHAIVLGIVLVWLLTGLRSGPVMVAGAALAGLASVLAAEALARTRLVSDDAAIGLVFPAMFAAGVLLINLNARNLHLDIDAVLLGEIGLVWLNTAPVGGGGVPVAVLTLVVVGAINLAVVMGLWKELKLCAFDPGLAQALGFRPRLMGAGLLALTSLTAVAAFEAVGVVLFLAFLIVPAVSGLLMAPRLALALGLAVVFGLAAVPLGYGAALNWDLPIGPAMALATGVGLALALAAGPRRGLVATLRRRDSRAAEARLMALLTHLAAHEGGANAAEECTEAALGAHLHWTDAQSRKALLSALDRGLIRRGGAGELELTSTGRARGRSLPRRQDPRH